MRNNLSRDRKIKFIFTNFIMIFLSLFYLYSEYQTQKRILEETLKSEMVLYYNFYIKTYSGSVKQKNILLQNYDENFQDELKLQNEFSKSTPLMMKKEDLEKPKYSLTFKFLDKKDTFTNTIQQMILQLKEDSYSINSQNDFITLFGRVSDIGYILIVKYTDTMNDIIALQNSLFYKYLFIGIFTIILLIYLSYGIKEIEQTKEELFREFEQLQLDTKKVAFEDTLTKAATRLKFDETLKDLINIASRFQEQKFTAIMIDIDNFKKVNDTYGHDYGDIVLKEVAKVVQEHIRKTDTFARWGGEEFVILSPMNNLEDSFILADKIREVISQISFTKLKNITCSFGLTGFQQGDDEQSIMKRADELLYKAKQNGKNRVEY